MLEENAAVEIERKYLPKGDGWRNALTGPGVPIRQGYLASGAGCTVRVRVKGKRAYLTVKGPTRGASRAEFEYPIPTEDAREMLETLCAKPLIEKTRYVVRHWGLDFEIDEFHGENAGLVLVEVELEREEQKIELPEWVGPEVTGDMRYYNSNLARNPFGRW
jgi:CYTH domain-containing protein